MCKTKVHYTSAVTTLEEAKGEEKNKDEITGPLSRLLLVSAPPVSSGGGLDTLILL